MRVLIAALASVTPYHRAAAQVREALGLPRRSYRARARRQRDLRSGRYGAAAADLGRRVRAEDGAARVIEALDRLAG
jgi:hypothetical protein